MAANSFNDVRILFVSVEIIGAASAAVVASYKGIGNKSLKV